jgi:hypothetical protein
MPARPTFLQRVLVIVIALCAGLAAGVGGYTFVYARGAQFLLDFIEAENSMGFHAPQEAMRILALSLEHTRRGQTALRR